MHLEFGLDGNVVLLDAPGEHSVNEFSRSVYNQRNIQRVVYYALRALIYGYTDQEMAIVTPYVAQRDMYQAAKFALVDAFQARGNRIKVQMATNLQFITVDSIQGLQADLVFFDTTVAGPPSFLLDAARILLAITRPQQELLVFADENAVR
jgi:superfamily I DNA and/or RNA helicase